MEHQAPFETHQLILIRGVDIFIDENVLGMLRRNFDPSAKISVQVAAGKVGTGKSSHQNVLLKRLSGTLHERGRPFNVVKTPNTLTQGVWVCVHPLFSPENPGVQILVVDLEGMFGLKRGDSDDTMMNLMKIYLFGMLISSVFVLHTMNKIDSETIKIMKNAFQICKQVRSKLILEAPNMFLIMKDMETAQCLQAFQDVGEILDEELRDYQQERQLLVLRGRGEPPKSFISSNSEDCSELPGTSYLQLIDEIIRNVVANPKINPISVSEPITISEFCDLLQTVCRLLNEPDMEDQLVIAIDYVKIDRMTQIYTACLQKCVNDCTAKAKTAPLTISIEEFKKQVQDDVEKGIRDFEAEVRLALRSSHTIKIWTDKQKLLFAATTKTMNAVELFYMRKIEAEQNEVQKKRYEEELEKQKSFTEKAKEHANILQRKIDDNAKEFNDKLENLQQIHDARLVQAAHEKSTMLEELNKSKVMSKEQEQQLTAFKQQLAEEKIKYNQQLIELDKIRKEDKKKQLEYKQQLEKLEKELQAQLSKQTQNSTQLIEKLHRELDTKQKEFRQIVAENDRKHRENMENLHQQFKEAQQAKEKNSSSGLFSFLTDILKDPFSKLALGIVKAILPKE